MNKYKSCKADPVLGHMEPTVSILVNGVEIILEN